MPTKDAAAPDHVWPHIGIHAADSAQPPGMGISPISDIARHHAMVADALATKSRAKTPTNTRRRFTSGTARLRGAPRCADVLVMAAPPDACLVASLGARSSH